MTATLTATTVVQSPMLYQLAGAEPLTAHRFTVTHPDGTVQTFQKSTDSNGAATVPILASGMGGNVVVTVTTETPVATLTQAVATMANPAASGATGATGPTGATGTAP